MIASHIDAFFKVGGLQVQANVIDKETLQQAMDHPDDDRFRNLLVRVSGYTAYFKDLNPVMQREIIDRDEY